MTPAAFNRRQRAHNRRVIRLLKARLAELGRRQRGHAEMRILAGIAAIGFCVLLVWAWPDVTAWLQSRTDAVRCPIPEQHEQLHIVVVQRGRNLAAECMYIAPRGQAAGKVGR